MLEQGLVTEEEDNEVYGPDPDASYANPVVAATQKALSPFLYDSVIDEILGGAENELERHELTYLKNGARYIG